MPERHMEFAHREDRGFVVFAPQGKLDAVQTPHFEQAVRKLLEGGSVCIIIDCAQVSYASSAGLRAFLALAKRVRSQGGDCRFATLNSVLRETFEISGFFGVLDVYETVESALK